MRRFTRDLRRLLAARLHLPRYVAAMVALYASALLGGMLLLAHVIGHICAPDGFAFDSRSLVFVHTHRTPWLDIFFQAITWAGSLAVLLPTALALSVGLVRAGRRFDALLITVGLLGASGLSFIIKRICERERPDLFAPLTVQPVTYSFPSSHSAQICAFALASYLVAHHRWPNRSGVMALSLGVLAACVVLSRVYLQVHYPSDIVGGALMGTVWVAGLYGLSHAAGMNDNRMRD